MRRRKRIEPTDDWDQLVPLFEWPEQKEYEEIRPLVLFGSSVAERARVTGTPETTMYRKVERFENEAPPRAFLCRRGKRQLLPRAIRRMIVDLNLHLRLGLDVATDQHGAYLGQFAVFD